MGFWSRILRPERAKSDLDAEIASHLALAAAEKRDRGATPEEARREAERDFGNQALVKDAVRRMWCARLRANEKLPFAARWAPAVQGSPSSSSPRLWFSAAHPRCWDLFSRSQQSRFSRSRFPPIFRSSFPQMQTGRSSCSWSRSPCSRPCSHWKRPFQGKLIELQFAHSEAEVSQLLLLGGDRISWSRSVSGIR